MATTDEKKKKREIQIRNWEKVQERAFTQWMTQTLEKRNLTVSDLRTDLGDGVKLINFFELLSGRILREKYEKDPHSRIQKIHNLHLALQFMERDMGVRNPGCFGEDIVDAGKHGIKLVLGLLWILFRKYRMNPIDMVGSDKTKGGKAMKEEDALLEWVRLVTAGYDGLDIRSFKTSFNDGLAFLALAHAFDKEACTYSYDEARKEEDPRKRLALSFEYAEKNMGINKLLEEEDVAEGMVDERALALYTSLFHHAYKTKKDMEAMKSQLGKAGFMLELEQKGKDELIKMNYELNAVLNETNQKLQDGEQRIRDMESSMSEYDQLKRRLEETEEQLAEVRKELGEAKKDGAELGKKCQQMETDKATLLEKVDALQVMHEEEESAKNKLIKDYNEIQNRLNDVQNQLHIQIESKEGGEKLLTEKLREETVKSRELSDRKAELEGKVEEFTAEVEHMNVEILKAQKDATAAKEQLVHAHETSRTHTDGLVIFRLNMEQHLSDLHRWKKYIEGQAPSVVDIDDLGAEIKSELDDLSFPEQLNKMSERLELENVLMTKALKQKQKELQGNLDKKEAKSDGSKEKRKDKEAADEKEDKKKKHKKR